MVNLYIVSEAPTPHNNFFFEAINEENFAQLFFYYLYRADEVPGRPWKSLTDKIGQSRVRSGVNKYFDINLFRSILSRGGCDVLFVIGWGHPTLVLLVLLAAIKRKPLLMWFDTPKATQNGFSLTNWLRHLIKKMMVFVINHAPSVIFVTGSEAAARLEAFGIRKDRFIRLPFFVSRFEENVEERCKYRSEIRSKYRCPPGAKLLVAAGRLIYSKGFDILIEALAQLHARGSTNWVLVLIGSGPEKIYLEEKVEQCQINDAIRMVSWMEYCELKKTIAGCDLFIAPARFDPFPTTVLMAMGYGRPVIASDQTFSAVDFIDHGKNGMLFQSGDIEDLVMCLIELLDQDDIAFMSHSAKQVMDEWPIERGIAIVKDAITRLVKCDYNQNSKPG